MRFYPDDHAVAAEGLQTLFHLFEERLASGEAFELLVGDGELTHEGTVVYRQEGVRDNLAFLLFRDGIRQVRFLPGLGPSELTAFVRALARAVDLDKAEHDLATILWEADLAHITYAVVDPLLEGEGEGERAGSVEGVATRVHAGLRAAAEGPVETVTGTTASSPAHPAPTSGSLLRTVDLQLIEQAMAAEGDPLEEFGIVLVEVLASATSAEERAAAVSALGDVLVSFLDWGELVALTEEIGRLEELRRLRPEQDQAVEQVLDELARPEKLRTPVLALDTARGPRRDEVDAFLLALGPRAYPAMLDLLADAEGQAARKCLLSTLTAGRGAPLDLVLDRLKDPRWYVVRNMVYLLGTLHDRHCLDALELTLSHEDDRVRREAARSLARYEGERALRLLLDAVDDPAESVRIVALRALSGHRSPLVMPKLLPLVQDRDRLSTRSEAEVTAVFDAAGAVGDDRMVPVLEQLWKSRPLLRSKRHERSRLGAVRALASIGTAAARDSLDRAGKAGDQAVRREARRCLSSNAVEAATR